MSDTSPARTRDRPVAGLILAGGASRRMGRPKALLELDGRSFVARGIEVLRAAGCAAVIVVDGAHRLEPQLLPGAELIHNPTWEQGPLSSLQVGLRAARAQVPGLAGVVVHHVERPRVRVETVCALLAALDEQPGCIWQPTHAGRSGHPIVWPIDLFDALLGLDPARETARSLTRGSAAALRRRLELDDPGVLDNIDTPAQLIDL